MSDEEYYSRKLSDFQIYDLSMFSNNCFEHASLKTIWVNILWHRYGKNVYRTQKENGITLNVDDIHALTLWLVWSLLNVETGSRHNKGKKSWTTIVLFWFCQMDMNGLGFCITGFNIKFVGQIYTYFLHMSYGSYE